MNLESKTRLRKSLALPIIVAITFCAPLLGIFSTPDAWYASLNKPTWNPPGWVFGPVWSALYLMMSVAAWLVWKQKGFCGALGLYGFQLVLNALWTPIFFGAHQIGAALATIVILWFAILATLIAFRRISKPASLLLLPYLAWVSFASFLNFTLWRLNP